MVPSKLKRHFTSIHPSLALKDANYFRRLVEQSKNNANFVTSLVKTSDKILEASYKVAELIVKAKELHTVAESLIRPLAWRR
jgi:hypothetical protein